MRPLHWAIMDKRRPVLVLTRERLVGRLSTVTVAPVSSTRHGLSTEIEVGRRNGLATPSVVKCDQIMSIPIARLGEQCGWLLESQERELHEAIHAAFDLT
jgi:mRNA interferase MazF